MKFDKKDSHALVAITDENGGFIYKENKYNVNSIDAGKRATKGKPIG